MMTSNLKLLWTLSLILPTLAHAEATLNDINVVGQIGAQGALSEIACWPRQMTGALLDDPIWDYRIRGSTAD